MPIKRERTQPHAATLVANRGDKLTITVGHPIVPFLPKGCTIWCPVLRSVAS